MRIMHVEVLGNTKYISPTVFHARVVSETVNSLIKWLWVN